MRQRRMRRRLVAVGVFALLLAAVAVGGLMTGAAAARAPPGLALETEELAPALAAKLAANATFAPPGSLQEGERGRGRRVPEARDAGRHRPGGRGAEGAQRLEEGQGPREGRQERLEAARADARAGTRQPVPRPLRLQRRHARLQRPHRARRDRARTAAARTGTATARLWIANANGGVWRTNDALDDDVQAGSTSRAGFEHNNVASIELDPNDKQSATSGPARASRTPAAAAARPASASTTRRTAATAGRAARPRAASTAAPSGSIAVKPGDSKTIFAASGRAVRGVSNTCCGGADALIPGAPHFGLYRSTNGGERGSS